MRIFWVFACGIALAFAAFVPATAQMDSAALPFDAAKSRLAQPEANREARVFFGDDAPEGAYPFIVALINASAAGDQKALANGQFCGGSLVTPRWVVTAAHCVTRKDGDKSRIIEPAEVDVYAGSNQFQNGERVKVRRVIRHPDYNERNIDNDIALLELAAAPKVKISTVTLATRASEIEIGTAGKPVIAAGWGRMQTGSFPMALQHVQLDVLDRNACNASIVTYRRAVIDAMAQAIGVGSEARGSIQGILEKNAGAVLTENMICSGKRGTRQDVCNGDSGGPLFAKLADGKAVQVGIVSFGTSVWGGQHCGLGANFDLYGIYARAANYADWVTAQIQ
jgi:secreted trypsin-like serine protease